MESLGLQADEVKDESHHPLPRRVSMPPGVLSCSKCFFEFYELQYIMWIIDSICIWTIATELETLWHLTSHNGWQSAACFFSLSILDEVYISCVNISQKTRGTTSEPWLGISLNLCDAIFRKPWRNENQTIDRNHLTISKAKQIKHIQIGTRIFALDARCLGFG